MAAQGGHAIGLTGPSPVVEFYNTFLGHYFMTVDTAEIADIDAGKAGPGWVRTGWSFGAFLVPVPADASCPGLATACGGVPVSRFYSRLSNSHFFTAEASEAAGLIDNPNSEWKLEAQEISIPVPDSSGRCATGLVPVYRFYNNRFRFNDSNHRFVTSASERERMRALGWLDEGVRFCAYSASEVPIRSFAIGTVDAPAKIRPSAQCEDESLNIGPCIAVNNLPTPNQVMPVPQPAFPGSSIGYEFYDRVGLGNAQVAYVVDGSLPAVDAAGDVFVQQVTDGAFGPPTMAVHVDTRHRGPNDLSSVNPLYQLHTSKGPALRDDRFFPFGAYESDVELALSFDIAIRRLEVRSPGGAAYGHPTLEFIDTRSNHHLYFTVLAYGTVPATDYLAVDTSTGKVIVGTAFGPNASYGRSVGASVLATPSGFGNPNVGLDNHGAFDFRMTRDDFRKVLADARKLDATLSADPADYLLDNFHFNNEVAGDGEIGLRLVNYQVTLLRR